MASFHELGAMESGLMISCIIVIISSAAPLISSALIPLLSADFPFFETVDCNHQSFSDEIWDVSVLLVVFKTSPFLINSELIPAGRKFEFESRK